jgi:hypothetical protein
MNFFNITISWGISLFVISVLALAVITHEFGHWLYIYRQRGIKMRFRLYKEKGLSNFGIRQFDDTGQLKEKPLTNHQMKYVLIMGIMFGAVPIFFGWVALINVSILGWFMIPCYFAGCKRDFDKLIDLVKKETEVLQNGKRAGAA